MERIAEILSDMTDRGRFIIKRSLLPTKVNVIRKVGLTLYFLPENDRSSMSEAVIVEVPFNISQEDDGVAYVRACNALTTQVLRMVASGEMRERYGVQ